MQLHRHTTVNRLLGEGHHGRYPTRVATGDTTLEVHLTVRTVVLVFAAFVVALLIRAMFVQAHRTISWAVAATVVAVVLAPIIAGLDRWLPRWIAIIISVIGVVVLAASLWGGSVASVRSSLDDLRREAPRAATSLEARYRIARDFRLSERVDDLIKNLETPSTRSTVGKAAGAASTYFVSGILMLFLLAYGTRITNGALNLVRPDERRQRWSAVLADTLHRGRRYVVLMVGQIIVINLIVGLVAWMMQLPAPMLLGLIAGALGCLPSLGILAGSLPAILLAGGFGGLGRGLLMLALAIALQLAEGFTVQRFTQRFVKVGPALPGLTALLAYTVYGIGAAVYGVVILIFVIAFLDAIGDPYDTTDGPPIIAS